MVRAAVREFEGWTGVQNSAWSERAEKGSRVAACEVMGGELAHEASLRAVRDSEGPVLEVRWCVCEPLCGDLCDLRGCFRVVFTPGRGSQAQGN
jgi:hypothetical protein